MPCCRILQEGRDCANVLACMPLRSIPSHQSCIPSVDVRYVYAHTTAYTCTCKCGGWAYCNTITGRTCRGPCRRWPCTRPVDSRKGKATHQHQWGFGYISWDFLGVLEAHQHPTTNHQAQPPTNQPPTNQSPGSGNVVNRGGFPFAHPETQRHAQLETKRRAKNKNRRREKERRREGSRVVFCNTRHGLGVAPLAL